VLQRTLAEILGARPRAYCSGRGGSMAPAVVEGRGRRHNAIVGRAVPMVGGQRPGRTGSTPHDDLTVSYFGDGRVNIGFGAGDLNLTSPPGILAALLLSRETTFYAVSTPLQEATGEPRLSARALGLASRLAGRRHDPLALHSRCRAQDRLRAGEGAGRHRGRSSTASCHQNGPLPQGQAAFRLPPPQEKRPSGAARTLSAAVAGEMGPSSASSTRRGIASCCASGPQAMRLASARWLEQDRRPSPASAASAPNC